MLQNKRFQNNNDSQDVVTVVGDNGVFYSLSNGANIKKDIFFQKYSEMLDASSFFEKQTAAGLASIVEQAKTMDSRNAVDGNMPPSIKVLQETVTEAVAPPAEYKEMLLKKFQYEQAHRDLSEYKVFENDDDAAADFEKKLKQQQPQQPPRQRPQYQDPYQQAPQQATYQAPVNEGYSAPNEYPGASGVPGNVSPQSVYVSPEEEAFKFFKSFKKVYPIKLTVDFDERIAEPNFIKLMAVNYEGDIIKFYTKEFMNRIYNDPGFLENKIYEKLKALVFEEEQKKERKPRPPKKLTEGPEKSNTKSIKTPKPNVKPSPMKKQEKDNG
jgi:hypothetical protein